MQTIRVSQVDAFTTEPLAGNPAGVVPEADGLTDGQLQSIAREMAVSETAFLFESDDADRRVRYFTPSQEVDLCGHATIASFVKLVDGGVLDVGESTLETNVGVLDVAVESDGTVWMTQDAPSIRAVDVSYDRVGEALGLDRAVFEGVGADLPPAVASTGLPFLVVPVAYLSDLGDVQPDLAAIESLTEAVGATGLYVFSFDALDAASTLHGRMFAPGAGVPEDPVTGTASGAVGAYLRRFDAFGTDGALTAVGSEAGTVATEPAETAPLEMVFEQGHYVDRPGRVRVRLDDEVRVGGRGVVTLDGSMVVPEAETDEIVEA